MKLPVWDILFLFKDVDSWDFCVIKMWLFCIIVFNDSYKFLYALEFSHNKYCTVLRTVFVRYLNPTNPMVGTIFWFLQHLKKHFKLCTIFYKSALKIGIAEMVTIKWSSPVILSGKYWKIYIFPDNELNIPNYSSYRLTSLICELMHILTINVYLSKRSESLLLFEFYFRTFI